MADNIQLDVARYSPERDDSPSFQSYTVPLRKDWVVLDALNHIKDKIDGSVTFRWSCRMGVCGSCGMMVNGKPKLTCATFLSSYAPGPVRVEPLRYFPVVRDLVVEMSDFMTKFRKVKPWLVRKEEKPISEGEYLQTPQQLEHYKQFSMCINCTLCYAACPVYGLDPFFVGPAAIAMAQRTTSILATRALRSAWTFSRNMKGSGDARSWASAPRRAQRMSTRRAPFSNIN